MEYFAENSEVRKSIEGVEGGGSRKEQLRKYQEASHHPRAYC